MVRKSPHLVLGVEFTGWLKLITVKELQEAESLESWRRWRREKLSFIHAQANSSYCLCTPTNKQTWPFFLIYISWTFIIQKYSTKNTHKKKKNGFHTVCKPQRRSSYNISTSISKLQLILLVVGVINVLSTQRDSISPRALYSSSAGENLTRILQGPILTAISLHVQYTCSPQHTHTHTVVFKRKWQM